MQCYRYVSFLIFVLASITAPDYYCLYRRKKKKKKKNRCKIGNNTIIWKTSICNGTKIVLKLYFEKLYIMIVTDMCAFVHAWVIALEYQFYVKKKKKKKKKREKNITFCLISFNLYIKLQ